MRIVIDPGHGGTDPGALGACGVPEKTVNLTVAKRIVAKLSPHETRMTRDADFDVEMHARGPLANDWGADLFVSIHCNSFTDPAANGIETYHYPGDEEGRKLAQEVQSRLVAAYGLRDRGIKTAEFAVLKETKAPAILVEMAFLSNPVECAILTSSTGQEQAATAIADGIMAYCGAQGTPIMGNAQASAAQARAWLKSKGVEPGIAEQMADAVWRIAPRYRLRPEIVLAQMCKETAFFRFGGLVQPWQNNFGGIGATGQAATGQEALNGADPRRVRYQAGVHGVIADTLDTGVEVNCQHLYAYATPEDLPADSVLVDPRFRLVRRGTASIVEHLGAADNPTGVGWAYPGKGYGHSIVNDYLLPLMATKVDESEQLHARIMQLEQENAELRTRCGDLEAKIARAREALS